MDFVEWTISSRPTSVYVFIINQNTQEVNSLVLSPVLVPENREEAHKLKLCQPVN